MKDISLISPFANASDGRIIPLNTLKKFQRKAQGLNEIFLCEVRNCGALLIRATKGSQRTRKRRAIMTMV